MHPVAVLAEREHAEAAGYPPGQALHQLGGGRVHVVGDRHARVLGDPLGELAVGEVELGPQDAPRPDVVQLGAVTVRDLELGSEAVPGVLEQGVGGSAGGSGHGDREWVGRGARALAPLQLCPWEPPWNQAL